MTDETSVSDTQTVEAAAHIDSDSSQPSTVSESSQPAEAMQATETEQAEAVDEQSPPEADTPSPPEQTQSSDQPEQPAAEAEKVEETQSEESNTSASAEAGDVDVSEQTPAAQPVDSGSTQQADSAAVSESSSDAEVAAPPAAADPTDETIVTPSSTDTADHSVNQPADDAVTADSDATPSPDPASVPHQPISSSATTDNTDPDTDAISPSLPQPAASDSSTQLISTVPAALSPRNQPAPIPRESTIQVRILLPSADEPVLTEVHILREYLSQPKPFLGGYRHHLSGRVKHHAAVQTERRQTGKGGREKVSRDSQTVETATRSAQSGRSVGTQMVRKDYYIGEEGETGQGERVIIPGEYVSSDVLEAQREERAKQIQCWLRRCFALRRMKQLSAAKESKESSERQATDIAAERRRREEEQQIHRRMHPKSKADFTLLYAELNAWRQHEAARIHTLELSDDERDTQLSALLSKEVKLLQTIDRLKIRAGKERKEEGIHRRLEMMQSPKEWTTSAGHHVEVVTPYTVRAQELTSLYQALLLPVQMHAEEKEADSAPGSGCLTWEGRVDVLLHCKYVVGEMASQLSTDILQLIEREQEWVRRRHATPGWHADQALSGMRKRLAALFLQFVQTPAFNPEAAVYVDSVGREGKQKMQELLKKPLAERELRKRKPIEEGQDKVLITRVQT